MGLMHNNFMNFLSEFFPKGPDEEFDYNSEEENSNQEFDELIPSDYEEGEILVYIMREIDNYVPVMASAKPSELLSSFQARSCILYGSLHELHTDNLEQQLCPEKSLKENGIRDGCILKARMPIEISSQITQLWEEIVLTDIQSDEDKIVFQELDLLLASYISLTNSNGLLRYAVLLKDGSSLIDNPHLSRNEFRDVASSVLAGEVTIPAGNPVLVISPGQVPFRADLTMLVISFEDGVLMENRLPSNGLLSADLLSFYPVNPLVAGQLFHVVIADHRRGEQELLRFLVHVI
jgi:hypothetical protein